MHACMCMHTHTHTHTRMRARTHTHAHTHILPEELEEAKKSDFAEQLEVSKQGVSVCPCVRVSVCQRVRVAVCQCVGKSVYKPTPISYTHTLHNIPKP